MENNLKEVVSIIKKKVPTFKLKETDVWTKGNQIIIASNTLIRAAIEAGLDFVDLKPQVINLPKGPVYIVSQTAKHNNRTYTSVGEAVAENLNGDIQFKNRANMAEVRAKGRICIAFFGLTGRAYSDQESPDFNKMSVKQAANTKLPVNQFVGTGNPDIIVKKYKEVKNVR